MIRGIETQTFSEYRNDHKLLEGFTCRRSYFEMSEWSLPKESINRFEDVLEYLKHQTSWRENPKIFKRRIWRNFL